MILPRLETYKNGYVLQERRMAEITYYPRHFSLSAPAGEDMYEFLIVSKDTKLFVIADVFSKFNIEIPRVYVEHDSTSGMFNAFCSFSKSKITPDDLSSELKKLDSVMTVTFVKVENYLFDKFFFPLYLTNESRGIIMRVDPLLKIENHLLKIMGSPGAAIMFDEGKTYAVETVQDYKSALPKAKTSDLLKNIVDGLRATGWGIFEFKEIKGGFLVTVKNPLKLKSGELAENRFTGGVIVGILESLYGNQLTVTHSKYEKTDDMVSYRLENRDLKD